ncbi:MAG: hypothetical protein OEZ36_04770 [Spirochaetota bacterium]|nr:hypothetical protein [Spirochaetota bacterium]
MRIVIIILLIIGSYSSVFGLQGQRCERYEGQFIRCSDGYYNRVKVLDDVAMAGSFSLETRQFTMSFDLEAKIRQDDIASFSYYFKKYKVYKRVRGLRAVAIQYEYYQNFRRVGTYHFDHKGKNSYSLKEAVWYNYKGLKQMAQKYSKTRNKYTIKNEYFNDFGILIKVNQNTYDRKTHRLINRMSDSGFYTQDYILGEQEYY